LIKLINQTTDQRKQLSISYPLASFYNDIVNAANFRREKHGSGGLYTCFLPIHLS